MDRVIINAVWLWLVVVVSHAFFRASLEENRSKYRKYGRQLMQERDRYRRQYSGLISDASRQFQRLKQHEYESGIPIPCDDQVIVTLIISDYHNNETRQSTFATECPAGRYHLGVKDTDGSSIVIHGDGALALKCSENMGKRESDQGFHLRGRQPYLSNRNRNI